MTLLATSPWRARRAGEAPTAPDRRLAEATLVTLALASILTGLAANQQWWDRHFLPMFAFERSRIVTAELAVRLSFVLAGVALYAFRRAIVAVCRRATLGGVLRALLAVALALTAGELILRAYPPHPHDADPLETEPRQRPDRLLGWTFVPARSVSAREAGRLVSYSFDAAGLRVPARATAVDLDKPTLVFTGESIMAGFGLSWQETIPARVGALLGAQSANLAVFDYSTDQAYLRLAAELPRFRRPIAVVTLFMPSLFDRNLLHNRPYLSAGNVWHPAQPHWQLTELLRWLIPYRSNSVIEQGIIETRGSLRALVALARARGAEPLIVVPQLGPESREEQMLRKLVLDEAGLPYVHVMLNPSWHLPGDSHPDPRAARTIAVAIARRLAVRFPDSRAGAHP